MASKSKSKNTVKTEILEDKIFLDSEEVIDFEKDEPKLEELYSYEHLLNVSSVKYIDMIKGASKLTIENVGVGDVYFGNLSISYDKESLILTGSTKSFNEGVYVISASRPLIKITYYK